MSLVNVEQALITAIKDGGYGLPIYYENSGGRPDPGTTYIDLTQFNNPQQPLGLDSVDDMTGAFQVRIFTPAGSGAMNAKIKYQEIVTALKVGTILEYGSQKVEIRGHHLLSPRTENGQFRVVGRINHRAVIDR